LKETKAIGRANNDCDVNCQLKDLTTGDYYCGLFKPAELGDADAQYNLGKLYSNVGHMVKFSEAKQTANKKIAVKWYTLAAEQGYDYAAKKLVGDEKGRYRSLILTECAEVDHAWCEILVNYVKSKCARGLLSGEECIAEEKRLEERDADANADIVKGASGFMIWGDKGWDGAGVKYEIKGCKTTYEQYIKGNKYIENRPSFYLISTTDWNKVNWKGTGYKYNIDTEGYVFEAPGEAGVQVTHRYDKGEDVTQKLEMYYGYPGGALKKIMFPITVALDRFENAAHDLMKECPGKKSKY